MKLLPILTFFFTFAVVAFLGFMAMERYYDAVGFDFAMTAYVIASAFVVALLTAVLDYLTIGI